MAEAAKLRERRFEGSGVTIVGDEAGPVGGTPVIMLHGSGQTRQAWSKALAEGARRGYHMIALDMRGHGDTDWAPDADYLVSACAADLALVIEQLGCPPPVLVGASYGGMIALHYAGEARPLKGLVMVDVAPMVEPEGAARISGFMRSAPQGFANLEEAADAVASYLPHRPRPKDNSGLMKNLRLRADGRLHWHWDPKVMNGDKSARYDLESLRAAARSLEIPVLLVRGRLSDVLSPEGVKDFLSLCPRAEHVDIQDAEHMVAGDRNDAFNAAVFDFLERHS
ncbi:MAG: alpha/beta hydrolase [Phenylobacterium sp.]